MNVFSSTQSTDKSISVPLSEGTKNNNGRKNTRTPEERETSMQQRGWVKKEKPQFSEDDVRSKMAQEKRFNGKKISHKQDLAKSTQNAINRSASNEVGESSEVDLLSDFHRETAEEDKGLLNSMANDPQDPATHQKLKDALSKGVVNFSQREKNILKNILSEY